MTFRFAQPLRILALAAVATLGARADSVTDFDDLPLAPNSFFRGPTANATDRPDPFGGPLPVKVGTFQSGGASFINRFNTNYGNFSGFAYSNVSDTTTPGFGNQFAAFTGSGRGPGMDNYGIGFGSDDSLDPTDRAQLDELAYFDVPIGTTVANAYVTNTTYTALSLLNGDAFAKKFGGASGDDPDFLLLTAFGSDGSGRVLSSRADFYLADFRFADNSLDYVVADFRLFDLTPLAGASRIYFNITGSDVGTFGLNTPAYFAVDDIRFVSPAAVPEPASWLACGTAIAIGGAASLRRRRRRVAIG